MPDPQGNPYAEFGGSIAPSSAPASVPASPSDPYAEFGGTVASAQPAATQTPGVVDRAVSGVGESLNNNIVAPIKAAVAPPASAPEEYIHAIGGVPALESFRAAKSLVNNFEQLMKSPGENYEQAKQDFGRALQEFQSKDYRNLASSVGSTAADVMGAIPGGPGQVIAPRLRELSEGARPGGNLAQPIAKDATDAATMLVAEKAPEISEAATDAGKSAIQTAKNVVGKVKGAVTKVAEPAEIPEVPKPVAGYVTVEHPFDRATIRKNLGGKEMTDEAFETLQKHVGDKTLPGGSAENTAMRAIKPVNEVIGRRGAEMDQVLDNAPKLKKAPYELAQKAIDGLMDELPKGTEDTLGKALDGEEIRYEDRLRSTDPKAINTVIRDLDSRIKSRTSPEDPLNTSADAQDAARVVIRRALRGYLNDEIPDMKPINEELSKNLELRDWLEKRFGRLARNPKEAEAQADSEFQKGQNHMANEASRAEQAKNFKEQSEKVNNRRNTVKKIAKTAALSTLGGVVAGPIGAATGVGLGAGIDSLAK